MQDWIRQYVNGLSTAEYKLQLAVLFLVLGFLLYKIYSTLQRFRFVKDTATSRIASAAQGYVELKGLGELLPGPETCSPFSQQRCLWYQCIVEKRNRLKENASWEVASNEISDHLFVIQDETGQCVIIPDGAHVIESTKRVWYGNSDQARFQPFAKAGMFGAFVRYGEYRFTEKLIMVADSLFASGFFETKQNIVQPDAINEQLNTVLESWKKRPDLYLSNFNRDKDGNISRQEWEKIRLQARQNIQDQQQHTIHHTLKKPAQNNQPFIISAVPESQLLKKKKLSIYIYLVVFFSLLYALLTAIKVH